MPHDTSPTFQPIASLPSALVLTDEGTHALVDGKRCVCNLPADRYIANPELCPVYREDERAYQAGEQQIPIPL